MSYVSTPQGPIESCELRSYFRTCPGNLALFGKNTTDRINPRTGFVNALSKTKHCLGFYLERLTLSERNALKDQPASLILQNMDMTVSKEYISQLHTLFDRHMRDEEVLIVRTIRPAAGEKFTVEHFDVICDYAPNLQSFHGLHIESLDDLKVLEEISSDEGFDRDMLLTIKSGTVKPGMKLVWAIAVVNSKILSPDEISVLLSLTK